MASGPGMPRPTSALAWAVVGAGSRRAGAARGDHRRSPPRPPTTPGRRRSASPCRPPSRARRSRPPSSPTSHLSACGRALKGSVWYEFTATSSRSVLLAVDAAGDMDAAVDVFRRQRSQLTSIDLPAHQLTGVRPRSTPTSPRTPPTWSGSHRWRTRWPTGSRCSPSSPIGRPTAPWAAAARPGASPAPSTGSPTRTTPGRSGCSRGRTYRMNFVTKGEGCASVSVHRPKTGFGSALLQRRCDAHAVFAAPVSGRYSFHVEAPRASRDVLRYRLRVGPALADDTAPGVELANDREVDGRLTGQRARRPRPLPLHRGHPQRPAVAAAHAQRPHADPAWPLEARGWAPAPRSTAGWAGAATSSRSVRSTGPTDPTPSAGSPGRSRPLGLSSTASGAAACQAAARSSLPWSSSRRSAAGRRCSSNASTRSTAGSSTPGCTPPW